MKRVLIITYYWPPSGGSGVQRWLKFSKYLPQYGWQPVIYTPSNPERTLTDETLAEEIPAEAEIVKRRIIEPYSLFRIFSKGRGQAGTASSSSAVNPINAVGEKSTAMKLSLWIRANIFVPDPRCLWISPSVRFLKKYLQEHPVDAIVSTGPPHSMHLIGLRLHKATGVKWVADFRDPWTRIFYFKHLPMLESVLKRHRSLEREVLSNADAVVSVTDLITRQMETMAASPDRTPLPSEKSVNHAAAPARFHTIENGYDEEDFRTPVEPDKYFTLTHTGVFSAEGNPENLWETLGELCREVAGFRDDLKIILAGKTDGEILKCTETAGLGDRVENLGYLKHSESNVIQQKARVLLLPLRNEPEADGILTGKYFEYLAAGRPIIAFGPHGGALDISLGKTGAGRIFEWHEHDTLREHILGLYNEYKASVCSGPEMACSAISDSCGSGQESSAGTWSFHPSAEEIARYSRRSLAGRIASLLDSLDRTAPYDSNNSDPENKNRQ